MGHIVDYIWKKKELRYKDFSHVKLKISTIGKSNILISTMGFKGTLVVLAFVATAYSSPISYGSDGCSQKCTDSRKFNYESDKTYTFNYESAVHTEVSGSNSENSGLEMTATVDVEVLDKCNMALVMRDVRLYVVNP